MRPYMPARILIPTILLVLLLSIPAAAVTPLWSSDFGGYAHDVTISGDGDTVVMRTSTPLHGFNCNGTLRWRFTEGQEIAEVVVTEMTPENRAVDGTEIDGWKVRVLELYENMMAMKEYNKLPWASYRAGYSDGEILRSALPAGGAPGIVDPYPCPTGMPVLQPDKTPVPALN